MMLLNCELYKKNASNASKQISKQMHSTEILFYLFPLKSNKMGQNRWTLYKEYALLFTDSQNVRKVVVIDFTSLCDVLQAQLLILQQGSLLSSSVSQYTTARTLKTEHKLRN